MKNIMSPYFYRNSYKDHKDSISSKEENSLKSRNENKSIPSRPRSSIDKSSSILFENKVLLDKIENIDRKFNLIIKENKELKDLIRDKTNYISKINYEISNFNKEIKDLKNITTKFIKFNKNNPINPSASVNVYAKQRPYSPEKLKMKSRNFSKSPIAKDFFTNPIVQTPKEDSILGKN
jgi:hypothetical protein